MKSKDSLYALLQCAITGECSVAIKDSELSGAFELSKQHGVSGIAFQGLQSMVSSSSLVLTGAAEMTYLQWMGTSAKLMQNCEKIKALQNRLNVKFQETDVRCLVLKGLFLAEYYDDSKLRTFGDLDIYSPMDYIRVNDLLKPISDDYTDAYYRHSECSVGGISVENHRYLTDIRGQRRWQKLEKYLHSVASSNLANTKVGGLYYPDETFSFIFFVYHALAHFIYEKLTLKFLVDWCMLLKKRKETPCNVIDTRLKEYGLMHFAAVMTKICVDRLGLSDMYVPEGIKEEMARLNHEVVMLFEEDLFCQEYIGFSTNSLKDRVKRGIEFYHKRWKIEAFLGVSATRFVWDKMIAIMTYKF